MPNGPRWMDSLPRRGELPETEFSFLLAGQGGDFLLMSNGLMEAVPEQWSQRQIYHLYRASTDLETFLDDYGARENRSFFPIREMTALTRWLSLAMTSLVHLDSRLSSYRQADEPWARETLAPRVRSSALALGEIILHTLQGMRAAWNGLGMTWPGHVLRVDSLVPGGPRPRLPRNLFEDREISTGDAQGAPAAVARLASQYLSLLQQLERTGVRPLSSLAALREFVANHYTEEAARSFEARAHNLQSSYDSLVAGSPEEDQNPGMLQLRGAVSQSLHLLEAATCLTHLYERHDVYGRRGAFRAVLEDLVPEERLLDVLVNGCILMVCQGLQRTRPAVESLLRTFTHQVVVDLELPEGLTLHARPISLLVSVVNHHGTPVEVEIQGRKASAASIMQMLMLAGSHPHARAVRFLGDQEVLEDLRLLFHHRLGEDGLEDLPDRLGYLRPE